MLHVKHFGKVETLKHVPRLVGLHQPSFLLSPRYLLFSPAFARLKFTITKGRTALAVFCIRRLRAYRRRGAAWRNGRPRPQGQIPADFFEP